MKIGIIGLGVVGTANKVGFDKLGHSTFVHDLKLGTTIHNVLSTDCVFLCVPTPSRENGECNTDIVESVLADLSFKEYRGVVVIRSTVIPGFTDRMIDRFKKLRICFSPEFVRERCAEYDFINDQRLLVVGTMSLDDYLIVKKAHGNYPRNCTRMKPSEAEILKYYLNLYASMRVTFANVFYEVCGKLGADYQLVKDAYLLTGRAGGDMYLDVNEELRGYGGVCLPKDTKAFDKLIKQLGLDLQLFETIEKDNKKFKKTVFEGMRIE